MHSCYLFLQVLFFLTNSFFSPSLYFFLITSPTIFPASLPSQPSSAVKIPTPSILLKFLILLPLFLYILFLFSLSKSLFLNFPLQVFRYDFPHSFLSTLISPFWLLFSLPPVRPTLFLHLTRSTSIRSTLFITFSLSSFSFLFIPLYKC